MSIKKQFLKSRPTCKVTFRVSKDAAKSAEKVTLVGDFNHWDRAATPMNALKSGEFTATLELDTKQSEYQFRYLLDERSWENDWEADDYLPNGIDGDNSIVRIQNNN